MPKEPFFRDKKRDLYPARKLEDLMGPEKRSPFSSRGHEPEHAVSHDFSKARFVASAREERL